MKNTSILHVITIVAAVASPFSAHAKDKHDKHDKHDRDSDHRGHYSSGPNISFHTYPYAYRYGGSYYSSPSYYSRPRVGISLYSSPSYVYRGREAYNSSYSDSLAADVQRELRRRGYYRGSIDGDIGPGSRAAIRAYQYDRGLSATGRIDSSLLRSLDIG